MRYITALLLHNKQGYHLAKLWVDQRSPHYWCLRDIVIHCAVVFTHKQHENFLQPFIKLMYNPATMKVCFLMKVYYICMCIAFSLAILASILF